MNKDTFKNCISAICQEMEANKEYLIALDQQNGDGDLGISMNNGFRSVQSLLETSTEDDLGLLMLKSSSVFNESAPSTLGTILSIGFMGMAKTLKGKKDVDFRGFAEAFRAGIEHIMKKAGAKPGEKTILDALCPASEAFLQNVDTPERAIALAVEAADSGSDATREMTAVHGHAARYGEKSLGILDGGAVAGKLIVRGICSKITQE